MNPERQQDIAVGIANALPGGTVAALTQVEGVTLPDLLLYCSIALVVLQFAYYAWKWRRDYRRDRDWPARRPRRQCPDPDCEKGD